MKKTKLELFISSCRSKSTKQSYRRGILIYMNYIYDNDKVDSDVDLVDRYLRDKRNYRDDLLSFIDHMEESLSFAPKTIHLYLSGVKELLFFNDIELSQGDIRAIKRRKPRAIKTSRDEEINIDILYRIHDHMKSISGKALVLFLASSGCRIGEALSIDMNDIDLTKEPARIYIRGSESKNQGNRMTFISDEAKKAVNEWLLVRDDHIRNKEKFNKHIKGKMDNRLFPIKIQTAYKFWGSTLRRSGLDKEIDEKTGRNLYTYHGLRRFFKTRLTGCIESEIVERLMGHEGYLNGSYYRVSDDDMASKYLKVMDRLEIKSVDNSVSRMSSLEEKIEMLNIQNQEQEKMIDIMKMEREEIIRISRQTKVIRDNTIEKRDNTIIDRDNTIEKMKERMDLMEDLLKEQIESMKESNR